ncbi:MAG TPA: cobalamin-dependent protein, partial [Planctomycetaceae bacterium]|nr:cobalamin-dependent protein [Planctomycetaceae bacterium]
MSRDILLATLNARYAHAAFGLRYLMANMGELAPRTDLLEFVASAPTAQTLETVLARNPKILGLGVYIWNVDAATHLVRELKQRRPELIIVLGGPEVSYETDEQEIVQIADYVIAGEADLAFAALCREILAGNAPAHKVIAAELPVLDRLNLPYDLYTDEDIARRVIYVEASRGCPYSCEFCLSALEIPVRQFALGRFLSALGSLFDRGARQFKFVDRTFNLNLRTSRAILDFFFERYEAGLFLHFEMIPDRFPESLRDSIRRFPPGALQFEVGVQTFNDQTAELISRRQDNQKLEENLRFLREQTGVHVHADLI